MTTTLRARLARTGQQQYESGPEWRSAEEVFSTASLATLANLKVQVGHAPGAPIVGRVVADSYGRERGPDGNDYLTAVLEITDTATVAWLRAGRSSGVSMGYATEQIVRDGRTYQTQIRFDHCALLRRDVEQPRCGTHCAVTQDGQQMTQRYTDAIDGNCTCDGTEAERERIQGYLDHFADLHGVRTDAIVNEIIRVHGPKVQATKILIADAAGRLNGPVNAPAVYVDGTRAGRPAQSGQSRDAAFRAELARKDKADGFTPTAVSGNDPDAERKLMIAGLEESKRLATEHTTHTGEPDTDAAFRHRLAKQLESK